MPLLACVLALASAAWATDECVPFTRARERVGQTACVSGKVVEVHTTGSGITYLNFCRNYLDCGFAVVIFPADLRKLGNVRVLQGREIAITGKVTKYRYQAEIAWHNADQLVVMSPDASPPKTKDSGTPSPRSQ